MKMEREIQAMDSKNMNGIFQTKKMARMKTSGDMQDFLPTTMEKKDCMTSFFKDFKNAFNDSCLMCVFVYGGYHALISHFVTRQMI